MYAIYGFNLVIIGFALRFTWQWLVDDVQTHNTTDHPTRRAWFLVIYTWFNMELVFYAYQYWLIRRSQTIKPGPSFELTHRRRLFDYTRSYARQNGVEMAKGWFLGSQLHEVRRDNGLEWLAWAFFHRPCNELSTGETRELHEMLVEIQRDVPSFATELDSCRDLESITHMFERHQLAPAIWMGHSFGTIICSWIERYLTRTILVDPVCFQLWEPGLVYNAIYRPPPNWLLQLMRCVVSSEHGIALTLGRHFWWHENILLPESLTPGSHIIVAEHDGIIDARKLSDYLTSNQVSHSVLPRAIHAQFLLQLSTASNILELI
ncbi:hypothetical protein BDF22DRAFT_678042 [Syncephalis plumigaleata]|nr:hypothetical protein BDF22DRAFT_678042 [Syncephalis plumigaleata]